MKYAVFVVGERKSGKSTVIRSLTGLGRRIKGRTWRLKALNGQPLEALILHSSPQELGVKKYPPNQFPDAFEKELNVNRNNYDILISALELQVKKPQFSYKEYVMSARNKGFNARITVIKTRWNGSQENSAKIQGAQSFAQQFGIPIMLIDASDDPNVAASSLRSNLYP